MALATNDVQTARIQHRFIAQLPFCARFLDQGRLGCFINFSIVFNAGQLALQVATQHNVGSPACHIGRNGNGFRAPGLGHNLSLSLVLLGVEHIVRQLLFFKETGD